MSQEYNDAVERVLAKKRKNAEQADTASRFEDISENPDANVTPASGKRKEKQGEGTSESPPNEAIALRQKVESLSGELNTLQNELSSTTLLLATAKADVERMSGELKLFKTVTEASITEIVRFQEEAEQLFALRMFNAAMVTRELVMEALSYQAKNQKVKLLYNFIDKSGCVQPSFELLEGNHEEKLKQLLSYWRVMHAMYEGVCTAELATAFECKAFDRQLFTVQGVLRKYAAVPVDDTWVKDEVGRCMIEFDKGKHSTSLRYKPIGRTQRVNELPPQWTKVGMNASGKRPYYVFHGPQGSKAQSCAGAWRMYAKIASTCPPDLAPTRPQSPVPALNSTPEILAETPRFRASRKSLHMATPDAMSLGHYSITTLIPSPGPSLAARELRSHALRLMQHGAFSPAPKVVPTIVTLTSEMSLCSLPSQRAEDEAKQSQEIAQWRAATGRQFEVSMFKTQHSFEQTPLAAREDIIITKYKRSAGPDGANIQRARTTLKSFEDYCKMQHVISKYPVGGGLMMAFIQYRQKITKSTAGGRSIAPSLKGTFVSMGMHWGVHIDFDDCPVIFNTCTRPGVESTPASSVSIRMVCSWEHGAIHAKSEAARFAFRTAVIMCHMSLRSKELLRASVVNDSYIRVLISLTKTGDINMWAGMHPEGFLGELVWYTDHLKLLEGKQYLFCHFQWAEGKPGDIAAATLCTHMRGRTKCLSAVMRWCFIQSGVTEEQISALKFTGYSPRHLYPNIATTLEWNADAQDECGRWTSAFDAPDREKCRRMAQRYASDSARARQLKLRMRVVCAVRELILAEHHYTALSLLPDFDALTDSDRYVSSQFAGMYGA